MLRIFRISEYSLYPEFKEGDFVFTIKIPLFLHPYKTGDIVVFEHPAHGRMIKRIQTVSPDRQTAFVVGNHPDSIDSHQFGPIRLETVLGKVLWHIKQTS